MTSSVLSDIALDQVILHTCYMYEETETFYDGENVSVDQLLHFGACARA